MKIACLALALLASSAAIAGEPVSFPADVKVSVDASGKLVAVDVLTDLPPPVRAFIEKRVATWSFSPPKRGDVTGVGVTYLKLGACALPVDGGGYRLAVDFKHNGPSLISGAMPRYPMADMVSGRGAVVIAKFIVNMDGRATLEDIRYKEGRNHGSASFDASMRTFVRSLHFAPEQLAGRPIATEVEFSVNFLNESDARHKTPSSKQIEDSQECRMASSAEPVVDQVALDSPINVKPSG